VNIYLDSSAIIYGIEGTQELHSAVIARIARAEADGSVFSTSRLSRLECRVLPLRRGQAALLSRYDEFFLRPSLQITDIGSSVIDLATDLRVRYGLKTPDAIHVATAMDCGSDLILTGDHDMARVKEIKVELV
jgi:predicted nucleic acid-binding protein